jgi:hypothetical protein
MNKLLRWTFLYDNEPFELFNILLKYLIGALFIITSASDAPRMGVGNALESIGPLWIWGIGIILLASNHLYAMIKGKWRTRKWAIMAAIVFWFFFGALYIITSSNYVNMIMMPTIAVFMGWVYIRVSYVESVLHRKEESGNSSNSSR